ncbi:MAG: hypothetical protein JWO08_4143 [Verrucomicrobiaceae bacterium]|nr:hypothetical protein [Verrucomicrobiaceae bacterium]
MNPPPSNGFVAALKRAFFWHWHALALASGVGFALLSDQTQAWLALVSAMEMGYLGFLGLNPRFQAVLQGKELLAQPVGRPSAASASERFQRLTSFLSADDLSRFQELHRRCSSLLNLRRSMDSKEGEDGVENFRAESLDRMLWLFLKLLHQKSGLERFLASTQRSQIEQDLKDAEAKAAASKQRDTSAGGIESRLTSSINERIVTIRERLENHDRATESLELVGAEIDKTEQQIIHLCEVGMTSRDSAGLSAQVDSISESLQSSEKAFAHASVASLLDDEAPPPLLSGGVVTQPRARPLEGIARR